MTLADALHETHRRWPTRLAMTYRGRSITYRELCSAVSVLADAYDRRGINAGDRILCALDNRPEHVIAMMAAWTLGAVHVGVDADVPDAERHRIAAAVGARALVHLSDPSPADGSPVDPASGPVVTLLGANGGSPDRHSLREWVDWTSQAGASSACEPSAPGDAVATVFVTHGTTGRPKFPIAYQRALVERWGRLASRLEHGPDDVHLAHLPMSHGFGLMMAVTALLTGGRLVFPSSSSVEEALCLIPAERITVLSGSPTLFRLMLDRRDRLDLRTVRIAIGSAAPFSTALLRQVLDDLSLRFMMMYGASEGVGVVTTDRDDILRGSVGRPQPASVTIVGPDRNPVPVGTVGEIAFSRSMFPVSYWDARPAESAREPAFYYSGDLGRFDDEGRLYIVGRLAHQVNRGGLKIDPVAIEAAVFDNGWASDVAVVGLPDPVMGEIACACVVPRNGQPLAPEDLRDELVRALGQSRCPDRIVTIDRIPRSRVGKVDYAALKASLSVEQPA